MKGSGDKNPRAQVKTRQRREKAAHIIEQAEGRRAEVYKTDPSLFQVIPGEIRRKTALPRAGTPERAQMEARILEMLERGVLYREIAAELGLNYGAVSRWATENGWYRGVRRQGR